MGRRFVTVAAATAKFRRTFLALRRNARVLQATGLRPARFSARRCPNLPQPRASPPAPPGRSRSWSAAGCRRIASRHQPIAVVLDLVHPVRPDRRLLARRRQVLVLSRAAPVLSWATRSAISSMRASSCSSFCELRPPPSAAYRRDAPRTPHGPLQQAARRHDRAREPLQTRDPRLRSC